MIDKSAIAKLMRLFATTIDNLEPQQVEQLLAGKARLTVTIAKSRENSEAPTYDRESVVAKLNASASRDEARQVLRVITSRNALEAFARTMKIHVVKHDRREDIEAKIIEFVTGGKLRSAAIQSLNLKGGSGSTQD